MRSLRAPCSRHDINMHSLYLRTGSVDTSRHHAHAAGTLSAGTSECSVPVSYMQLTIAANLIQNVNVAICGCRIDALRESTDASGEVSMSEQNEEELEAKMEEFLRQQAERESGVPLPLFGDWHRAITSN